jgi:hypothetical protein
MVKIVPFESGVKIMAETSGGQEITLATKPAHGKEDLSILNMYDVAVGKGDAKKTIVEYYHLGPTAGSSWRYTREYKDSIVDIKKAFDEAGLKMPDVVIPSHIKFARTAMRVLGLGEK